MNVKRSLYEGVTVPTALYGLKCGSKGEEEIKWSGNKVAED